MKMLLKYLVIISLVASIAFVPILVDAHQSGCHRWHSCPSDSGSYVCGDLGYYTYCPKSTPPKSEEPKMQPELKAQPMIPKWIKSNAKWWSDNTIDDETFVSSMQYLVKQNILKIPQTAQGKNFGTEQIPTWVKNNAGWWSDGSIDDSSFVQGIQFLIKEGIMQVNENKSCSGNARCITGTVTEIIDGDTIKVDGQSIRFALSSAPEISDGGGTSARDFIENICPVGSSATVDEDDK